MMSGMIDPAVGALLSGAFALLFLGAALHKWRDLASFQEVLRAYDLLPAPWLRASPLVPVLEFVVGAGLLGAATRAVTAAGGAVLLTTYAAAIAVNLGRGRRDLSCGCGGPNDKRPIAAWMVWRNLTLAALLGAIWLPWSTRPLGAADALTVGAGTVVAAFLYLSLDTLLGRAALWNARLRASP
jgi:hypothetical protein